MAADPGASSPPPNAKKPRPRWPGLRSFSGRADGDDGWSQAAGCFRPCLNVGPVPGGSAADGPSGFGEDAAVAPDIDGVALNAEAVGEFGEAYGLAWVGHADDCTEFLGNSQEWTDNQYMIDTMHGHHWAKCGRRGCKWEGPMRDNHWDARDDEANHRAEHAQGKR